jgi:hypothetical protein
MTSNFSRPDKLDHAETILYEIDMVRFARSRLCSSDFVASEADMWIYLEAFLLHFRNVIEFFRGRSSRSDDLNICDPKDIFGPRPPDKSDLDYMTRPDLWNKYEGRTDDERISKYLQHCTKRRIIKKKWDVNAMFEDLKPIIDRLESLLPQYKPATQPAAARPHSTSSGTGNSTASTRILNSTRTP